MDELASLQESAREMALERFRIIQPHLEHDRSLSLIARTTKIPYRTIHRWLTRYRRFGLAALARKAREDRGKRRALSPRLMQVAEALALEVPPLPVAAIYRWICQIAKDTGNSAPSYDVIYEVVRQVPAGLLTLAHEGKKAPLSTWCTAGRQSDPMRFGKRITPSSISWCSGKAKIRLNHGLR